MTAIYAATVILFILNFPIKLTAAACFETANKRVFGKLKIFGINVAISFVLFVIIGSIFGVIIVSVY